MKHFLLTYDVAEQQLRELKVFDRPAEASEAYERLEMQHLGDESVQIVLIAADSLETVKATHGNYFAPSPISELVDAVLTGR
jgi:hypothetical protein